ncbi:MAG: hypothetical protein HY056_11340 [Proteobacteria bacterium]|nr:hypothetical protein [Pseudomonadota bacterium]
MINVMPLVSCARAREHLRAALPGEPLPAGIDWHVCSCESCRDAAAAISRLDGNLRAAHVSDAAPDLLWQHVANALDADELRRAMATSPSRTRSANGLALLAAIARPLAARAAIGLAAAALLIVAIVLADPFARRAEGQMTALVREPINDLITYRASHRPLDLASESPRLVADWWADKLDFHPPAPAARIDGYRLVGARLCYFLNRRLSALMYQKGENVVSLYVMSGESLEIPSAGDERIDDWNVSVREHKGYTSLIWREGTLAFALVADLPRTLLLRAATDLRRSWGQGHDTRVLRSRAIAMVGAYAITQSQPDATCPCAVR